MDEPTRLFSHLHFDYVEGLPMSPAGNSNCLFIIDRDTGYCFALPVPDRSTNTLIDAYTQGVLKVVGPASGFFVSDQGKSFVSDMLKDFVKSLRMIHCTSSIYNPQSNGVNERNHGTLMNWLAVVMHENQRDWDAVLWLVCWHLNQSVGPDGVSPYELVFKVPPPLPFEDSLSEVLRDCVVKNDQLSPELKRKTELVDLLRVLRADRRKRQYAKRLGKTSVPEFVVGDLVLYVPESKNEGDSSQLALYAKRARVKQVLGKGGYLLEGLEDKRVVQVNIRRIRRSFAVPEHLDQHLLDGDQVLDQFEVDRILDERVGAGSVREFLVKWRHFSLRSATWEPEANLENAPLVLSAWRRLHPPLPLPQPVPGVPKPAARLSRAVKPLPGDLGRLASGAGNP